MSTELDELRRAVDAADAALLAALAQRLAAVHAIAAHKRAHHLPAFDRAREDALHARWAARAADAGLPPALADGVLTAVLDGCRAEVARLLVG